MKMHTPTVIEDLAERLAVAKAKVISAEETVGRAVLNAHGVAAARKALRAVQDDAEGLEAAQREEERRVTAQQEREARNAESDKASENIWVDCLLSSRRHRGHRGTNCAGGSRRALTPRGRRRLTLECAE